MYKIYDLHKFTYIDKSLLLPFIAFLLNEYIEIKIILCFCHIASTWFALSNKQTIIKGSKSIANTCEFLGSYTLFISC